MSDLKAPSPALALPAVTENGGRVELRHVPDRSTSSSVCYFGRWFVDEQCLEGWLYIEAPAQNDAQSQSAVINTKALQIRLDGVQLPEWLSSFTHTLVRTCARTALTECSSFAQGSWPRRITRWRKDRDED